jgi:hypothetical protein
MVPKMDGGRSYASAMKSYEIRVERHDADLIELGVWTGGRRCHRAVLEVAQSAVSFNVLPPTLERDPSRFWSSAIQVGAEMLKFELLADTRRLSAQIRPDVRVVEQWAQWEPTVPTVAAGGVVRAFELPDGPPA